ncbi:TPA: hypothetical protein N0F65_003266 [Lagenidium giganteum]|uniref:DDRGK domain-containing protein 1 n=1 Tax=Lagenidium giganteum TaxID=4803 RepID=A0AAV2YGR7_9STRA|nr:TPA: hypothetical protein N0F65_003266 [Lagenidium giganteum]
MTSDGALLVIALSGLATTVFIILYFAGFFRGTKQVANAAANDDVDDEVVKAGGRRGAAGGLAALRKRKEKKRRDAAREEQNDAAPAEAQAAAAEGEAGENREPIEPYDSRAMSKKELQKELKRREREEMRIFEEQRREEQRKRNDAKEEALQKKREDEARFEQMKEEEERRLAEEKAKKEQEEFDQWKNMFSVEEEGSKADQESEESQELLQQFVAYIEQHKVVLLEDLATEFHLTTQEAIRRVEALQESNRITGIVDDRGKFIYITEEEMDKVARFIQRKGRLGLVELSKECNKLIRLEGEKEATPSTSAVDWLNEMDPVNEAAPTE